MCGLEHEEICLVMILTRLKRTNTQSNEAMQMVKYKIASWFILVRIANMAIFAAESSWPAIANETQIYKVLYVNEE